MACSGVKGSQMAAARMLNMLPKEDDDANLMYLHSTARHVDYACATSSLVYMHPANLVVQQVQPIKRSRPMLKQVPAAGRLWWR